MKNNELAAGMRVHIDTDNQDWGRVASDGVVLETPRARDKKVLIDVESIRAGILVPLADICLNQCTFSGDEMTKDEQLTFAADLTAGIQKKILETKKQLKFTFTYKHPKRGKLQTIAVYAYDEKEALESAPNEIEGGYLRYGLASVEDAAKP